ncbi:hypothetical protein HXX25_10685 [Hyphobacterium sp. CCMP332]|uniref:hypothetical protein n=1 Tax=Hyphobacterium sp. CCMP332 TaxID=2749086 RepID=UPI001650402C|nr:hypothetical protein [Hyphobacterium sp. CCMP332]QNL19749.1 hypothetical protein HXX25_10685 [Hyphobacterium sp. CCMP332]
MNRRRDFLDRTYRARQRKAKQSRDLINPAAMMRFAGLVAAILIGIAVFIGFDSERMESGWMQNFASLDAITRPVFLGGSLLEYAIILSIGVYAAWALWRSSRARSQDADDDVDDASSSR